MVQLTKEIAKSLQEKDFIPRGKPISRESLSFRRTTENEVYRCCAHVGNDLQSGPMFCGKIAEFVAFTESGEKGYVGLCGTRGHVPPKKV